MLTHDHVTTRTVARAQRVQQRLSAEIYRTKHAGHTLQHNISPFTKVSGMRRITSFFNRPAFAAVNPGAQTSDRVNDPDQTSHSSPQSLHSNGPSYSSLAEPGSQLALSLSQSIKDGDNDAGLHHSFLSTESAANDPSPGTSFNSSQRVMKNGKEVVISSDGEDTDSLSSFESPDDLLARIVKPPGFVSKEDRENDTSNPGMTLRNGSLNGAKSNNRSRFPVKVPKYSNTLDSLVVQAVDDNETEAGIAKLKAAFEKEDMRKNGKQDDVKHSTHLPTTQLNEDTLASALGDQDDEMGLRRLLDAVRRTEALDLEKSWHFFDYKSELPPAVDFPKECIDQDGFMFRLRERHSRERALHSGIVDFALSRSYLPDGFISWVFKAVPSETQDSIRQALCRAFRNVNPERVKSLIKPADIDQVFQQLGTTSQALATSEKIVPDAHINKHNVKSNSLREGMLVSVLELLSGAADLFAEDTRERALNLLFRLTLDVSLTSNFLVCSELERTIVTMLESAPDDTADDMVHRVCTTAFDTIKDATSQSRLVRHILPTSDWLALLRCRLAVSFLTNDASPLSEPPEMLIDLKRMTSILSQQRFDVKWYKGKGQHEYDYGELGAVTILLNIAIDSGRYEVNFPDKEAEKEFNSAVDALSDRLKIIFTSIEDSGASHLKRTLAKEAIEALHYRVVYSVRTKPRPKKSILGVPEERRENKGVFKSFFRDPKGNGELPFRPHDTES
ncbi:hypothetical protein CBS63078_9501 [Aspergillus niger]|uniref:Uncharacterized protein n=3 Tax=Aspergillus niger TaxID=5061 RepID=A2R0I9_ASPNC|nr:hypothetical protein An12g08770 [Aspergillus niger]XP_025450905.1 uncharacterized protein BO96DRAFT_449532 [Aspergillus niger CBS 101883]RDH21883.1 hypothetical protein M747DRAFT_369204 [Aspergillus niger ATCC 13496]KAI2823852.1 hypothetical protein CBS115989_1085 [Aspergillus niger]KAI2852769.1 hypothetical protein CBS11350_402 [Aspergillus niger]KAI2855864.1 hypothetical protein CBS11232_4048 [Aspergillus niger]KAI2880028.1 hypothetical protein CBS115988_1875 [Aspergillus niger]|eukprot:XP_001395928.1 hypothetical protein ANI_1_2170104 [Aspergillus niger CBS 513.88]